MRISIQVDNHVRECVRDFERAAEAAMRATVPGVVNAVREEETRRKTGRLHDSITATEVKNGRKFVGYEVGTPVFYARFQEYGTLGRRRKKLAQPGRRQQAAGKGSGIKPLRFFGKGIKKAFPEVVAVLRVELGRRFG